MEDTRKKMSKIEDLININQHEGLIKMIDLYKEASNNYDHETCDSIELWIYETHDKSIINYIKEIISIETDESLKMKYLKWITYLDCK